MKQRVIKEIEAANTKADEISKAREATQLGKDANAIAGVASQVKGASPAMTSEEVNQLIKENPQYRETYRKAGLIDKAMTPDQQRMQAAEDKVQGALSIGAHSSVVDAFQKSKKDVLEHPRQQADWRQEQGHERQASHWHRPRAQR